MAKKQLVMEWTDDHDILLLREMIASELFQFKKGSPDRGKIWESIQERLNKLDHPKFTIKEKKGVRDRCGNLLQVKFKVAYYSFPRLFFCRIIHARTSEISSQRAENTREY